MKNLFSIFSVSLLIVLLACGQGDTTDIGVRINKQVPAHGHSGALDGGTLKPQGALVYSTLSDTLISGQSYTYVVWTSYLYDTAGVISAATPTSRITIPVGYAYADVKCTLDISRGDFNNFHEVFYAAVLWHSDGSGGKYIAVGNEVDSPLQKISTGRTIDSHIIPVLAGDYIRLLVWNCASGDVGCNSSTNLLLTGASDYLAPTRCSIQLFR